MQQASAQSTRLLLCSVDAVIHMHAHRLLHQASTQTGTSVLDLMFELGRFMLPFIVKHAGYERCIRRVSPTLLGFARCAALRSICAAASVQRPLCSSICAATSVQQHLCTAAVQQLREHHLAVANAEDCRLQTADCRQLLRCDARACLHLLAVCPHNSTSKPRKAAPEHLCTMLLRTCAGA